MTGGLELFPERKDVGGKSSSPEKPDNSQQREGVDVCARCNGSGITYRYYADAYGPAALHPVVCVCRFAACRNALAKAVAK